MPHLPFHRYIGPGTNDFNPEPLDSDDKIAREHDLAYQFAESASDVRDADAKAVYDFAVDSLSNPHSILGAVGIGAKYAVESLTGVKYGGKYAKLYFL